MDLIDDFYLIYFTFDNKIEFKKKNKFILVDNQGNEMEAILLKEISKKDRIYLFDVDNLGEINLRLDYDENGNKILILTE